MPAGLLASRLGGLSRPAITQNPTGEAFTPVQGPGETVKGGSAWFWSSLPEKQLRPRPAHVGKAISSVVERTRVVRFRGRI